MSKKYSNLLSDLIDKSGLSLTQIAQKAEMYGQKITTSYLSKLKNGKMPPPSFKMSIALALTLDVDPELLLAAGMADNKDTDKEELQKTLEDLYTDLEPGEILEKVLRITLIPEKIVNPPTDEDYPTDEELTELGINNPFTENEHSLIKETELSLEYLKDKYTLEIDGTPATNEEIEKMIEYIKIFRIMKQNERS